ncbi:MTH1187 family thiamine-binding protein [Nitrosopumilus sp. K4]|uniref:MTH1187 family thiamine-binding protein n=1 Tax=Nitrosopumilus sp. K4 TaxID=2795383 RepID=UPI001BA8FEE3|nr:MTH1187 family thiamine-binding protein [Nitrosopumilus sp. K4]QUC65314.1 MTH1187 family thiamine-binding protein [Nitrosopumilus sp. K4]
MINAEISIYPVGTNSTSASFYIAKAIESIQNIEGIRYEINPMGTVLESDNIDTIYEASKKMMEVVHNLGVNRVEVVLKVDSRKDKHVKMEEKLESIKKQMKLQD